MGKALFLIKQNEQLGALVGYKYCFADGERITGNILWQAGGWTSGYYGNGSGDSIDEIWVKEEFLYLFVVCFLIIDFENIGVWLLKC